MKNKAFTLVELLVVMVFILALSIIASVIVVGCKAVNKISDEGLKNTATEIWEGPEKSR